MANARPSDARAGFEIYREAGRDLSLDEVNDRLGKRGFRPVSKRMRDHYRKLIRAGFNRYIPINRFGVAKASQPYGQLSSLARYSYRKTDLPVHTHFFKAAAQLSISGRVSSTGDVGASIRFIGTDADQLNKFRPSKRNIVMIEYITSSVMIPSIVVDVERTQADIVIEVEYKSLASVAEIMGQESMSPQQTRFTLTVDTGSNNTLDIVGRRLHSFFNLLEGVRAIANEAGQTSENTYYIGPPVVQSLSISSPMIIELTIPTQLTELVSFFLPYLPYIPAAGILTNQLAKARKSWYEGSGTKIANQDLERRQMEQRTIERQKNLSDEIDEILDQARVAEASVAQTRAIVERDIQRSLRELSDAGVINIGVVNIDSINVNIGRDLADERGNCSEKR